MTPGILVNPTEARRTGLGGHHPNKEPIQPQGDSYDEGTLRQATSLVDVQHSYPPELSRLVHTARVSVLLAPTFGAPPID